jgi:hypothetical protein
VRRGNYFWSTRDRESCVERQLAWCDLMVKEPGNFSLPYSNLLLPTLSSNSTKTQKKGSWCAQSIQSIMGYGRGCGKGWV